MQIRNIKKIILAVLLCTIVSFMPIKPLWAEKEIKSGEKYFNINITNESKPEKNQSDKKYKMEVRIVSNAAGDKGNIDTTVNEILNEETYNKIKNSLKEDKTSYSTNDYKDYITLDTGDKFKFTDGIKEKIVEMSSNGELPNLNKALTGVNFQYPSNSVSNDSNNATKGFPVMLWAVPLLISATGISIELVNRGAR